MDNGAVRSRSTVSRSVSSAALVVAVSASAAITAWLIGTAAVRWWGDQNALWIVGRAAGITGYLLLVALVLTGLALSHPRRKHRLPVTVRIRLHTALATFTFVFVGLHIVVLATDSYAGVGLVGAVVPFGSHYRPAAVTLGVVGLYAGLAAGLTALFAGSIGSRVWWPIHKVAIVSLVLIWAHSLWAGTDTSVLLIIYAATGALVIIAAVLRYTATTPSDMAEEISVRHRQSTNSLGD